MADVVGAARLRRRRPDARRHAMTYVVRFVVVAYVFFLVAWPTALVATNAFDGGLDNLRGVFDDPGLTHALRLTVVVAGISVVVNLVFGVGISILLVRYEFPGKRVLNALRSSSAWRWCSSTTRAPDGSGRPSTTPGSASCSPRRRS